MLHETLSAWVRVDRGAAAAPLVRQVGARPGSRSRLGAFTVESGVLPSASAAAAVTSLNVEPGG